ncbi:hypothetical protein ACFV0R_03680 [Streptomyces sp. NPDC059578]|uniref:hypothetical protein n=1 Tax=Streptomyces sp. NPDC059578 TaxID=3346874 RepID=UPI003675684F
MRDSIARILAWVLRLLLPARGQHRAPNPPTPAPAPDRIAVDLRGLRGAFGRFPGHDPDLPEIPPVRLRYVELSERFKPEQWEQTQKQERRLAIVAVTAGREYPYTYPSALRNVPAPTGVEASA